LQRAQFGLDKLAPGSALARFLAAHRIGVLAHPASVDRELTHIKEKLARCGIRPVMYFGPEHGFGGEAQDMIGVADARDPDGVPIRSLYGEAFSDLSPRDEDLSGIDVMLVDLADVGSRYYTFVWTAVLVLRACAKKKIKTVVLDRPASCRKASSRSSGSSRFPSATGSPSARSCRGAP
jgi:uncharacterized protein YbbC (DUF1343 family)